MSLWRNSGQKPKLLEDAPEIPALGAHVWKWFTEIHQLRKYAEKGAQRIAPEDVKGWMWFTGIDTIELWERKAISALDSAWLEAQRTPK